MPFADGRLVGTGKVEVNKNEAGVWIDSRGSVNESNKVR